MTYPKLAALLGATAVLSGQCALAQIPGSVAPPNQPLDPGAFETVTRVAEGMSQLDGQVVSRQRGFSAAASGVVTPATAVSAATRGKIEQAMVDTGAAVFKPKVICDSNVNLGSPVSSAPKLTTQPVYYNNLTVISGGVCPSGASGAGSK